MRIRGAVLEETRGKFSVQELDLAAPGPREVLVRLRASCGALRVVLYLGTGE
jgi:Zn-dependent alcohol dehydrogenase